MFIYVQKINKFISMNVGVVFCLLSTQYMHMTLVHGYITSKGGIVSLRSSSIVAVRLGTKLDLKYISLS